MLSMPILMLLFLIDESMHISAEYKSIGERPKHAMALPICQYDIKMFALPKAMPAVDKLTPAPSAIIIKPKMVITDSVATPTVNTIGSRCTSFKLSGYFLYRLMRAIPLL